jgi:hypothetical protein
MTVEQRKRSAAAKKGWETRRAKAAAEEARREARRAKDRERRAKRRTSEAKPKAKPAKAKPSKKPAVSQKAKSPKQNAKPAKRTSSKTRIEKEQRRLQREVEQAHERERELQRQIEMMRETVTQMGGFMPPPPDWVTTYDPEYTDRDGNLARCYSRLRALPEADELIKRLDEAWDNGGWIELDDVAWDIAEFYDCPIQEVYTLYMS